MTQDEYNEMLMREHLMQRNGCGTAAVVIMLLLSVTLLCGCRTQYVPVETIKEVYITKHDSITLRDSIWQHDSVYVAMKGDTLLVEKWRTKYVEHLRDVVRVDSFIKTDSIQVPYPVERKLNRWEKICIDYGKIMIGATVVTFIAFVVLLILWLKKRFGHH